MDRPLLGGLDRASLVHRLADHVHDAAQGLVADGNRDRLAGIDHLLAAHQALGRIHGDGAHRALAEMLGDFEHEPVALIVGLERVQDLRQVLGELHVDHGAHHLAYMALGALAFGDALLLCFGLGDHGGFACHIVVPYISKLERLGAGNDLDQLLGDHRLARAVISQRQPPDHVAGIAGRIVHGAHAGALLRGRVLEQRAEDLRGDVEGQEVGEDVGLVGLVFIDRAAERSLRRGGLRDLRRDDLQGSWDLADHRAEARKEQRRDVELPVGEQAQNSLRDPLGILES